MHDNPEGGYRRHGHPAETIGLAAVAALALEALLPETGAPGWVLPAVEIIATAGSAIVTWSFTGRKSFPVYLASLGLFLGGWTAWAQHHGLWHQGTFGALFAGTAAMIPWGVRAWHKRHGKPEPIALPAVPEPLMIAPEPTENEIQIAKFQMMFEDLNREFEHVQILSLDEERAGRVLRFKLPLSGKVTIEDFRALARRMEVVLEAQEGAVNFENGAHSGEVIMKIRERDGFAGVGRLLPELRARTVTEDIVIGVQEDGSYLRMPIREIHAMIIGMSGSGKSNLLNVIIAQLASCVDTVIWAIDMKGGRAIRPWFQAWEDGYADAPPIDWIATTRAEAELMMNALDAAVDTRMKSRLGMNKIKPTAGRPQVILITDEMADLFGDAQGSRSDVGQAAKTNDWFIKKGNTATQKGRSEAVTTIWASQRGTTSMGGSTDMKANVDVRIALRPSKSSELEWIVPDVPQLAKRQLMLLANTPGVGMMGRGLHASQPTKFLHHDHIDGVCGADDDNPRCPPECPVYQTEIETGPVRPRLDQMTAAALGSTYAQRWARARDDRVLNVPVKALAGGSAAYGSGPDKFDEIIKGARTTDGAQMTDPERDLHPGRIRMREYVAAHGIEGTSVRMIEGMLDHEGISVVRETVHRWLALDREEKLVHHPSYRRWVSGPGPNIEGE